jgi:hypothetical protein
VPTAIKNAFAAQTWIATNIAALSNTLPNTVIIQKMAKIAFANLSAGIQQEEIPLKNVFLASAS